MGIGFEQEQQDDDLTDGQLLVAEGFSYGDTVIISSLFQITELFRTLFCTLSICNLCSELDVNFLQN